MKRILSHYKLTLGSLLTSACLLGQPTALAGEQKSAVVLSDGTEVFYDIAIPDSPTSQEKKAAEIMADALVRILPRQPDILQESARGKRSAIFIGATNQAKAAEKQPEFPESGYRILVDNDKNVILDGHPARGVVNAAVSLLQEDFGFRLYSSYQEDSLRSPQIQNYTVEIRPRAYSPELAVRDPFLKEAFNGEWALFNRVIPLSDTAGIKPEWGGMRSHPREFFVHTFDKLVPPSKYFESHPEFFPLVNGERIQSIRLRRIAQLSFQAEGLVDLVAKRILEAKKKYPTAKYFSVSQNDSTGGWCDLDRPLFEKEGSWSGPMLKFVNAVARKVAETDPSIIITTLAYEDTFMPPETIRPEANVQIILATDRHAWRNPYFFIEQTQKFAEAFEAWKKIGVKPIIWDYTFGSNNHWIAPVPNLRVVEKNFEWMKDGGIEGIMWQGAYQSPGASLAAMRAWTLAQKAWNPALDMQALEKEFCLGFYGPAGPAMHAYVQHQDAFWRDFHSNNQPGAKLTLDRKFVDESRNLINEALAAAGEDERATSFVERELASVLYARLMLGPENEADVPAFSADIEKLRDLTEQFKITSFSEFDPNSVERSFLVWERATTTTAGVEPGSPDGIQLPLESASLLRPEGPLTPSFQKLASGEIVLVVPQREGRTPWSVQWRNPGGSQVIPGETYTLRVQAKRKGELDPMEPALTAGWWDYRHNKSLGGRTALGEEIPTDSYDWIEFGEITAPDPAPVAGTPAGFTTIYLAPAKSHSLVSEDIYINAVELRPER